MKKLLFVSAIILFLAVNVHAASNVTFAWNASQGATGYRVYQSTVSGTYDKVAGKVCDTAALTCTVNNVPDGTYFWVATAYDAAGNESAYGNEVTATLDSEAPLPPTGFRITVTVNLNITP